jgi:CheY-specific phosphatase CheX
MQITTPQFVDEVREFLIGSVAEVFSTMLNTTAQPASDSPLRDSSAVLVVGSVGFIGDVSGMVYVSFTETFARNLASRMLGMPEAELDGNEMVNDVIGELTNMIVGAVKSHLCDTGVSCVLTIPTIVRGRNIQAEQTHASESRLLAIACENQSLLIELLMKPRH